MPSQAGLPKTLAHIAKQAIEGDKDAAFLLAKRAPGTGLLGFLARWVPEGSMTVLAFNTLADAYDRMLMEREAAAAS